MAGAAALWLMQTGRFDMYRVATQLLDKPSDPEASEDLEDPEDPDPGDGQAVPRARLEPSTQDWANLFDNAADSAAAQLDPAHDTTATITTAPRPIYTEAERPLQ